MKRSAQDVYDAFLRANAKREAGRARLAKAKKPKSKPSAARAMALLRRHSRALEQASKSKLKAAPKPVVKPSIQVGHETNGYSLIHKKDREIVLATIRGDKKLVQKLGNLFKVNGSYRIGRVRISELPYE